MTYSDKIAYIAGFYGLETQLVQTAEACAELAQAALKFRKALPDDAVTLAAAREHLIEEMADVMIMLEQLNFLEACEDKLREMIERKLDRQIGRIEGNEAIHHGDK